MENEFVLLWIKPLAEIEREPAELANTMASARLCSSLPSFSISFPSLSSPAARPSSCPLAPFNPSSLFTHAPLSLGRPNQQFRRAGNVDLLGDFGARDPFPAEIESNFGEKVLGNVDTEHRILIPNISALSLAEQECNPISPSQPPLTRDEAQSLLRKVVGWRLVDDGGLRIECWWKVRDSSCGSELINRINKAIENTGHQPKLHLEQPNQVRAELQTSSIGGLSMNDFIVAAKIDQVKTSDLIPKKRVWA